MFSYISSHPDYIIILLLSVFLVVKVIVMALKRDDNDSDEDDSDGGVDGKDPVLDLPPGVSLPVDSPKPEPVY